MCPVPAEAALAFVFLADSWSPVECNVVHRVGPEARMIPGQDSIGSMLAVCYCDEAIGFTTVV